MIELAEDNEPQDNCYSAADMADQGAKSFVQGYRQALIDLRVQLTSAIEMIKDD